MPRLKKMISFIFIIAITFSILPTSNSLAVSCKQIILEIDNPYMFVDGIKKEIDVGRGTAPILKNGRTIVPIRAIIETMGGSIGWNESEKKITIKLEGKTIELWIDNKKVKVNGAEKESDVAPAGINGRTMLPLRFVTENLGCSIDWNASTKRITINTGRAPITTINTGSTDFPDVKLTDDDIKRLQAYPRTSEKYTPRNPSAFEDKPIVWTAKDNPTKYAQTLIDALLFYVDNLLNYDHSVLESDQKAKEKLITDYFKYGYYEEKNVKEINRYIDWIVNTKAACKAKYYTDTQLVYSGSYYVCIRGIYVWNQTSGSEMDQKGTELNRWYKCDFEWQLVFTIPVPQCESGIMIAKYVPLGQIEEIK